MCAKFGPTNACPDFACLKSLIQTAKLEITSLHEPSVSDGCCVTPVRVTRMQSTPEMSAAEMSVVTEKQKRREKNRQEHNKGRNERIEGTVGRFCNNTPCMEEESDSS